MKNRNFPKLKNGNLPEMRNKNYRNGNFLQ